VLPEAIAVSGDDSIWFSEATGNKIAKLNPASGEIKEYPIPTLNANPFSIDISGNGDIWFAEPGANKIGRLDTASGVITEYTPKDSRLDVPTAIAVDNKSGLVWFTEHLGNRVTVFNPKNESFKSYSLKNPAALPYGIAIDESTGNVWFTEHGGNALAVLNPSTGSIEEYPIPTSDSSSLWLSIDSLGNVWFAEAGSSKIAVYGTLEKQISNAQGEDPFFTNTLILASIALIVGATTSTAMTLRRIKQAVKTTA